MVLAINAAMFFVESVAGILAGSTSLLADSLDMLGDAAVYGFTLWVLHRGPVWRARAALLKGTIMAVFGFAVLLRAVGSLVSGEMPHAGAIGAIGALALAANTVCVLLLYRRRADDVNLRSTWICSRNDIIANVGVLLAGAAVALLGRPWPDILVGVLVAGLFLRSSLSVLREGNRELRDATAAS